MTESTRTTAIRTNICSDCEKCRFDPEHDCGIIEHAHCLHCQHCLMRHAGNRPTPLIRIRK